MARKYFNFIGGALSANLSDVATSMSSAALSPMPAVTGADHAVAVIDPDGSAGAPEVVWITVHGASTDTATILRGQEGTVARAHKAGTEWSVIAPASSHLDTTWISFTPSLSGGTWSLGNGSIIGRYRLIDDTVHFQIKVTFGSTSDFGGGANLVIGGLPFSATTPTPWVATNVGVDVSDESRIGGLSEIVGTQVTPFWQTNNAKLTPTTNLAPMTWADGDYFSISGFYERT